jgi:hypothetical protein
MRRNSRELGAERPVQALICALLRFLRIFQDCAYGAKYEISYFSRNGWPKPSRPAGKTGSSPNPSTVRTPPRSSTPSSRPPSLRIFLLPTTSSMYAPSVPTAPPTNNGNPCFPGTSTSEGLMTCVRNATTRKPTRDGRPRTYSAAPPGESRIPYDSENRREMIQVRPDNGVEVLDPDFGR